MNKFKLFNNLIVFILLATSTVLFSQSVDEPKGCVPHTAAFTPTTGLSSWAWDFGNGAISSEENPDLIFTNSGIYTVTLRETTTGPILWTTDIEVYEKPILGLKTENTIGCPPFSTTLIDSSSFNSNINLVSYLWDFGDGSGSNSTTGSISHTYSAVNEYDVSMSVTTNLKSCDIKAETFFDHIKVVNAPTASFSTSPTSLLACEAPLTVNFTNNSSGTGTFPLTYNWDFGNSITSTEESPSSQTYTTDGTYNMRLNVAYDFGCSVSTQKTASIGSPVASITKNGEIDCSNNVIIVSTPVAGAKYQWLVNDINQSTSQSFSPNLPLIGENEITLILSSSDGLCSDTAITTIIKDDLEITLTSLTGYSCEQSATFEYEATTNQQDASLVWSFVDGSTISNSPSVEYTHNLPSLASTIYYPRTTVTATNDAGCIISQTVTDTLSNPKAFHSVLENEGGCTPLAITFKDSSFIDRTSVKTILLGNGDTQTITDFTTYQYLTSGDFETRVVIENDRGCSDTSSIIIVKVGDNTSIEPNFTVLEPVKLCYNELVSLQNLIETDLDYTYSYPPLFSLFPFDGVKDQVTEHQIVFARNLTEISQRITYNGCRFTSDKKEIIDVDGSLAITGTELDCETPLIRDFSTFPFSMQDTVSWSIDSVYETSDTSFTKDFLVEGTYQIMLITDNDEGCKPDTNITTVQAVIIDMNVEVPNLTQCINTLNTFDATNSKNVVSNYTWIVETPTTSVSKTSKGTDTTFSFNQGGDHEVFVTGTDVNNCPDTTSLNFKVFDLIPMVTSDLDEICNPDTVTFTNSSSGDTTLVGWTFSFADGSDSTFTSEPSNWSHIYLTEPNTGNNYITSIQVTDVLGCNETGRTTILRYAPSTQIQIEDATLCAGDSITISARDLNSNAGNLDFSWDLGINGTSNTSSNTVTYLTAGRKEVKLFVTEPISGCPSEDTIVSFIDVEEYPVADFTTSADGDTVFCAPLLTAFTDASTGVISSRIWNFGDSSPNTSLPSPIHTFQKGQSTTQYIVSTSFGCSDTLTKAFNVIGPEGDFEIDKTGIICQGEDITFTLTGASDIVSYSWSYGDGIIDSNQTPVVHQYLDFPPTGSFPMTLLLEGLSGCDLVRTRNIPIENIIADFSVEFGDSAQCWEMDQNISIQDSSTNADNYSWDFGNNLTDNSSGDKITSYDSAGTYDIKLIITSNTSSCIDEIIKQVILYPMPEVEAIGDTSCANTVDIKLSIKNPDSTSTYVWSPSTGLDDPFALETTANVNSTTNYVSTVTDTNQCVGTDTAVAFIIQLSDMADFDTTIVIGDSAKLPVFESNFRNFEWTPTSDLSCLQCDYPYSSTLESLIYSIRVTDDFGCQDETYEFDITVRPETNVRMPTTFSPNEDGINDIVYVQGWGIKELVTFEIYNRWGELLYTSTDIEEGWNGRYKGDIQNSDAYAYRVVVKDWRDKELETEGYLNLIH